MASTENTTHFISTQIIIYFFDIFYTTQHIEFKPLNSTSIIFYQESLVFDFDFKFLSPIFALAKQ